MSEEAAVIQVDLLERSAHLRSSVQVSKRLSVVVRIVFAGACNTERFCLNFWQRSLRKGEKENRKRGGSIFEN